MRLAGVANPSGRRWAGFAAAAVAAGLRPPGCCSWLDLVHRRGLERIPGPGRTNNDRRPWLDLVHRRGLEQLEDADVVRLDSPGEDTAVHAALAGPGRSADEVAGTARWATGLALALDQLGPVGGRCTPLPADVVDLFDKRRTHRRLKAAGVPVAPALDPVTGWEELRTALAARGWTRAFVKVRHGSSGSGVVALSVSGSRCRARAHVEVVGTRLYNSLRLVTFDGEQAVGSLVDAVAREGIHVERWVPKATVDGVPVDLRVVCVAGRATHVVVRGGRGPLTNLHLGNRRVDLDAAQQAFGDRFDLALLAAEAAAAAFPGCLQLGVDVGIPVGSGAPVVFEANAFGDLLPGVVDVDGHGRSTWEAQVDCLLAGWRPPSTAAAA